MFDIDFRVSLQVFIQIMFCNKAINGEKAAFNNTVFGRRKRRTIEAIIKNMHLNFDKDSILKVSTERHTKLWFEQNFCPQNKSQPNTVGLEALADAFISGLRKKEEQRKVEFLSIGQVL
jgi:hypothetical protein